MENFKFRSFDEKELNCYLSECENPHGIVQIIHGMKEHSKRYFDFINFLNDNNYIVFISDLRGHGLTSDCIENLGYSDGDIYIQCVNDQLNISRFLKDKYPDLPLYIIGHSFGSFVTQGYITKNELAEKVILSGSAYNNTLLFKAGSIIAKIIRTFKGKKSPAIFIEKLSFNSFSGKFPNGNWLTRDEEIFAEYVSDPLCTATFPNNFYVSMFSDTPKNYKKLKKVNNKVKLMIASGSDDPLGNNTKSVIRLEKVYRKSGFDTTIKLYPECRHEILNELNRNEVYDDFLKFLNNKNNQ